MNRAIVYPRDVTASEVKAPVFKIFVQARIYACRLVGNGALVIVTFHY